MPLVLHVDLDQFLAAVEVRRRPELVGRPVVVGGDGDPSRPRQVVATASYEARACGVRSGMPLATAARRCPDAVFLPSDRPAYEAASEEVMAVLRSFGVPVEVWGWDEAFLAVPPGDAATFARTVQQRVLDRTGLVCTVGLGETKLQAKTAAGFAKPAGVGQLTRPTWMATMGHRPVTALSSIGSRTAARLAELGVRTVEELARTDHAELAATFGPRIGPSLRVLALGGDDDPVVGEAYVARSRSREVTYPADLVDAGVVRAEVVRLATELAGAVAAEGRVITHVSVKLRTATFFTRSRIARLATPTTDPGVVADAAVTVLGRFPLDRPVRLLGVRVVLEVPDPAPVRADLGDVSVSP